jgi:3-oxoacyl-[acyl-carrier-protein] synthase III
MPTFARVAGLGHYLPPRVVTNDELAALMDTSDAWIRERTGIRERRFVDPGTGCTDLGVAAARSAMARAGWEAADVDHVVFATLSPDLFFPGNGALLQHAMGLGKVGALDVRNQCSGFVHALAVADGWIRMGMAKRVLVVGAEVHSRGLRLTTEGRDTAVIFGDGGGAACLEAVEAEADDRGASRFLTHRLHADGKYALDLCVRKPGFVDDPFLSPEQMEEGLTAPHMNGREVFRHAVTKFPAVIREVLEAEGYAPDDLDFLVPHQANLRITEAVRERTGLPEDRVASNIARYGNTTAASIPIAFSEAVEAGQVKRGDLVCLAAFGAGFTWGANLLRY